MKVYSLYFKETYVASFPSREDVINYAKRFYPAYDDAYECNFVEEYLSKSPIVYTPPHYTSLHSIPYKDSGITFTSANLQSNPYNSVDAEKVTFTIHKEQLQTPK